ncbi:MAG: PhnD/SsuA/transferrin family substrate-binding protein [Pseudomonadota bacterium]
MRCTKLGICCWIFCLALPSMASACEVPTRYIGSSDSPDAIRGLVNALERQTGFCHEAIELDYEQTGQVLTKGKLDSREFSLVVSPPYRYVAAKRQYPAIPEPVASIERFGATHYGTVLLSTVSVPTFDQLQELTFVYPDEKSTSGYLAPLVLLHDEVAKLNVAKLNKRRLGDVEECVELKASHRGALTCAEQVQGFAALSSERYHRKPGQPKYTELAHYRPLLHGPEDIPFDPIIILPAADEVVAGYREALTRLISYSDEQWRELDEGQAEPADGATESSTSTISGLRIANDGDYDPVRRMSARLDLILNDNKLAHLRLGASLAVQPQSERAKRKNWEGLQRLLYSRHNIFLELSKTYSGNRGSRGSRSEEIRDEYDDMLADLDSGEIDIAELPPIPAGKAITLGHCPVAMPVFREGATDYEAIVIGRQDSDASFPPDPGDGVRVAAVGPPENFASASGYAFLAKAHKDIDSSRYTYYSAPYEVVASVADPDNGVEFGYIARFRFDDLKSRFTGKQALKVVTGQTVSIPNGLYVLRSALKDNCEELSEALLQTYLEHESALSMQVGLAEAKKDDKDTLMNTYEDTYPADLSRFLGLLAAALFVGIGAATFVLARPDAKRPGSVTTQRSPTTP